MVVRQSSEFAQWLADLRDLKARTIIARRLRKAEVDNHLGELRSVGGGVSEMKIDYGPGYRLYFTRKDSSMILLLVGGDKATQVRDILRAQRMADQSDGGNGQ